MFGVATPSKPQFGLLWRAWSFPGVFSQRCHLDQTPYQYPIQILNWWPLLQYKGCNQVTMKWFQPGSCGGQQVTVEEWLSWSFQKTCFSPIYCRPLLYELYSNSIPIVTGCYSIYRYSCLNEYSYSCTVSSMALCMYCIRGDNNCKNIAFPVHKLFPQAVYILNEDTLWLVLY